MKPFVTYVPGRVSMTEAFKEFQALMKRHEQNRRTVLWVDEKTDVTEINAVLYRHAEVVIGMLAQALAEKVSVDNLDALESPEINNYMHRRFHSMNSMAFYFGVWLGETGRATIRHEKEYTLKEMEEFNRELRRNVWDTWLADKSEEVQRVGRRFGPGGIMQIDGKFFVGLKLDATHQRVEALMVSPIDPTVNDEESRKQMVAVAVPPEE